MTIRVRSYPPVWARSLVLALTAAAWTAPSPAGDTPVPGTTGAVTAVPDIAVPHSRPCVVPLFDKVNFTNFSPKTFDYAPPARCRGPWAKVVLEADYSVNKGVQFDRTASIWIGNVNVYFGTTQEPSSTAAPAWHVERDLTDYSSWLRQPHSGRTLLGNIVNDTYTGIITGSAKLVFYPGPAPRVPDQVVSLSLNADGDVNNVQPGSPRLGRTLTLPRNMVAIYMDVFAQSQQGDEFWELCVPDAVADTLQSCSGSGFRQSVVYIDGQPAGVAPVYPWIYTGGVSPALWRPIPGVQTLNFRPFRVNLTPFAGQLDDGQPHDVELGVVNAQSYFSTVGTLLIYTDPHREVVRGQLLRNTLDDDPGQHDTVTDQGGGQTSVSTTAQRRFAIAGYVDTSRGRIRTEVDQSVDFSSEQQFTLSDTQYRQHLVQSTQTQVSTRVSGPGRFRQTTTRHFSYPLELDYNDQNASDGTESVNLAVTQSYQRRRERTLSGHRVFNDTLSNTVSPHVTYHFDAAGNLSIEPWASTQRYTYANSLGQCFDRRIASSHYELTEVEDGVACGGHNHYAWSPLQSVAGHSWNLGDEADLWTW
ncbi:peptide-N4-asparagine amidase [Oleiagrimonas sp. C23AA]|uniref:peptide-N4-asparagine amidase n=1 Tax=Oleiagrimonas sp. C23AA TaxID=2719047 RepID=UPI00141F8292|nr:peptide-N4-asparagine amidase [Oleiagrimonas sp. C23AA]NII09726.1 peptide-N(4)-(N-acetyl-beta-glucosaminyl)asparagine amidase [Oleiagrimonas sp. C23AA]